MGMSTHVIGFRPPDKKWEEMKTVWDACEKAGVPVPDSVMKFFEYSPPDKSGVEVEIKDAYTRYIKDGYDGFEVDISKLPKDVKVSRFFNSSWRCSDRRH